jgi:hypothetical protein
MGVKFRRFDTVITAGLLGVFFNLKHILKIVRVKSGILAIIFHDIGIIVDAVADVTVQLMTAEMVQYFTVGPVLINLPGKEVVKAVADQVGSVEEIVPAGTRLWENLCAVVERNGIGRLIRVIERSVIITAITGAVIPGMGVGVSLLVAV